MVFQSLNETANSTQERHFCFGQLNFSNQCHEPCQDIRCERLESNYFELPLIGNILELSTSRDANDLVIERITVVKKMPKDFVDEMFALLGDFDTNPLP